MGTPFQHAYNNFVIVSAIILPAIKGHIHVKQIGYGFTFEATLHHPEYMVRARGHSIEQAVQSVIELCRTGYAEVLTAFEGEKHFTGTPASNPCQCCLEALTGASEG